MKFLVITVISLSFSVGCQQNTVEKNSPQPNLEREKMVKYNQYFLKQESMAIKAYIQRRGWNMQMTESGLWYEILNKNNGKKLRTEDQVKIKYKLELLDGTSCYTSDSLGKKDIVIGKSLIESGLEEGLQLMQKNSKARFILPSHLAYGVSGDGKCIPPRSAIVYNVEVLSN